MEIGIMLNQNSKSGKLLVIIVRLFDNKIDMLCLELKQEIVNIRCEIVEIRIELSFKINEIRIELSS